MEWRRRESNPRADFCKALNGQSLQSGCALGAAIEQHSAGTKGHPLATNGAHLSSLPASVAVIADAWPALPPHIRESILTLVDAGTGRVLLATAVDGECSEVAWRLARKCRNVVQACLREEEWGDADREFFQIICADPLEKGNEVFELAGGAARNLLDASHVDAKRMAQRLLQIAL